mgnify:FL=1
MSSPLVTQHGAAAVLPSCFCADVAYYAALASHPVAVIDSSVRFDKRAKHHHRTTIASTHGPLTLTVPVQKPAVTHGALWSDILVSSHDEWWHIHTTALESAYGRSPFFEYYADSILPLLSENAVNRPVTNLNAALDNVIRSILGIDTSIIPETELDPTLVVHDYRRSLPVSRQQPPYYQVRADKLGFLPSMSILDLIFNLGPEAPLYLHKLITSQ